MEPSRGLANIHRWLAPLNCMISFKELTIGVLCNKCVLHNYSHFLWHGTLGCFNILKGYQWMIIMNLSVPMKLKLRSGDCIGHSIMFPSPKLLWPQVLL
jgi:hypothetical protein